MLSGTFNGGNSDECENISYQREIPQVTEVCRQRMCTHIRLLLKKQSDQGMHSLPFQQILDALRDI